jgi:HEXXH motif-containing protein
MYNATMLQSDRHTAAATLFDYGCEDASRDCAERGAALDGWLAEQVGEPWWRLREALPSPAQEPGAPQACWELFLYAFDIAAILVNRGRDAARAAAIEWWSATPKAIPLAGERIVVVPASPALQRALDDSWRADVHGVSLVALDGEVVQGGLVERLQSAIRVLRDSSPTGWGIVDRECGAVVMVATSPRLAEQGAVSLTVKRVPGMVMLSDVPLLLLLEGLVHESAHLWLNGVERVRSFCGAPDLRLATPLRRDPRPVSGLLHQAWVLVHLCVLHDELAAAQHPALVADAALIQSLRGAHRRDLGAALATLEGAEGALTPDGARFVSAIRGMADAV